MSSTKGLGQKILHGVPLTALAYEMPSDGIPLFPTWRNNAMDIYWSGYDSLREPMECKERNLSAAHWQLQCTKGLGRLSMILFGVFWTFLHKDDMSDGVKADFCRWAGACHGLLLIVNKFDFLVRTSMAPWVKFIDPWKPMILLYQYSAAHGSYAGKDVAFCCALQPHRMIVCWIIC